MERATDPASPGHGAARPADGIVTDELRALLSRADVPAGVIDATGAVVWANEAQRRLLGDAAGLGRRVDPFPVGGGHGSTFRTDAVDATGAHLTVSWIAIPLGGPDVGALVLGRSLSEVEEQAAEADARFRRLVEQIPAATYIDDLEGPTLYISPQVESITGYTSEEWTRDPTLWERRMLHPADRARMLKKDDAAFALGTAWSDEYRIVSKDGSVRWIAEKAQVLPGEDGRPALLQGVMFDVTEQREALDRLADAESRYRQLIESIPAAVYLDADEAEPAIPLYVSPRIERLLGYPMHDWNTIADLWTKLLHPDDRERAIGESDRAKHDGANLVSEYRMIALDGRTVWIHDEAIPLRRADGTTIWQGFMLDVTARKEAEAEIARLATHDGLTDLPNRERFDEELARAIDRSARSGRPLAVMAVGLDLFRLVNDSFGHDAGDAVLREVAERLAPAVRSTDLFARRSGDEFLVLLEDLDPSSPETAALQAAGRLQGNLRDPFVVQEVEVFLTATIGVAVWGPDGLGPEQLIARADDARRTGKTRGPGTVTLARDDGVVGASPEEGLRTAARLRRAVDREEWVLHYQPIVDLGTGQIVGAEALVRWEDPETGLALPATFLPLAETLGLIEPLGSWVVQEACRQVAAWAADGAPVRVSVNLSPREFRQPDLAGRILRQIRAAGVAPASIMLEIGESTAMTDDARTTAVVDELRAGGLGLAIDDAGTGASSPTRLADLRPDLLKIDRSLVGLLPGSAREEAVVRAILRLADALGLPVVAEGIETADQERFLLDHGCSIGQGFRYSRPVPADQLRAMLGTALRLARR